MGDSSGGAQSSFEGLRQNQAVVLLDILRESTRTERSFVERRYCEKASGFPETLAFLTTIQAVEEAGDGLRIGTDCGYSWGLTRRIAANCCSTWDNFGFGMAQPSIGRPSNREVLKARLGIT